MSLKVCSTLRNIIKGDFFHFIYTIGQNVYFNYHVSPCHNVIIFHALMFFYLSNNGLDAFHGINLLVKTMTNNFFARRLLKIVFKLLASKPFPKLLFCKNILMNLLMDKFV